MNISDTTCDDGSRGNSCLAWRGRDLNPECVKGVLRNQTNEKEKERVQKLRTNMETDEVSPEKQARMEVDEDSGLGMTADESMAVY